MPRRATRCDLGRCHRVIRLRRLGAAVERDHVERITSYHSGLIRNEVRGGQLICDVDVVVRVDEPARCS